MSVRRVCYVATVRKIYSATKLRTRRMRLLACYARELPFDTPPATPLACNRFVLLRLEVLIASQSPSSCLAPSRIHETIDKTVDVESEGSHSVPVGPPLMPM